MNLRGKKKFSSGAGLGVSLAAIAVFAAACGSSGDSGSSAPSSSPSSTSSGGSSSAASTASVTTRSGDMGTYLTDSAGRTLYLFASDTPTKSTCSGTCAAEWPPFTVKGTPKGGSGADGMIGTIMGANGTKQVTYEGHPLYYFAGDTAAGQTKGEGLNDFGAKWLMLTPAGKQIDKGASSSTPSSGSSSSSSSSGSGAGGAWS